MVREVITDEIWRKLEPLLPAPKGRHGKNEILSNVVSERLSIPSVFFIFKPLSLVLLRP